MGDAPPLPPPPATLLPPPALARPSPSRADGVAGGVERAYRAWACELIQDCGIRLRLRQAVMATAQSLLQRFYHRRSLAAHDAHVVAMAALFLAAKVEEQPRRMRDVLNVCYHAKLRRQRRRPRPVVLGGNLYAAWKGALIRTERVLLKETGFAVHHVMAGHPHKFLLYYVRTLGEGGAADALAQAAWAYLNDALRTDLCVRHLPESIACGAIYLAARATRFALPRDVPWHAVFNTARAEMLDIAEEILALYEQQEEEHGEAGGGGGSGGEQAVPLPPRSVPRRGPGRPAPQWLPSLRPDARAGEDDEEGEEPLEEADLEAAVGGEGGGDDEGRPPSSVAAAAAGCVGDE